MVTFTAWIHLLDHSLHDRQYTHWGGGLIEDLFPDHQRVVAEYRQLPPHRDIKFYTGTMSHYLTREDEAGAPDIVSTFVAWDCYKCNQTQHRFTRHEFAPSGGAPHCIWDFSEPQFYDPSAATPVLCYQIFSKETGGNQDAQVLSCWERYFVVQCRECQIRCRVALDQTWREASGRQLDKLHVCHGDPINSGVLAAARYREPPQDQVPAGGDQDQEEEAGAGDEDHGGNQDPEEQDKGDGSTSALQITAGGIQDQEDQAGTGDEDHGGNQDQEEQDKVDGSTSTSQITAGGNQDQEDQTDAGDEDLSEDDRGRKQDREDQDKGDGSASKIKISTASIKDDS